MFHLGQSCHWKAFNFGYWWGLLDRTIYFEQKQEYLQKLETLLCREPVKNSHTIPAGIYLPKLTIGTLEQGVKYAQS